MKGYQLTGDDNSVTPIGRLMIPMGEISYFNTTGVAITVAAQSDGSTNMVKAAPTTTLLNDMGFDNGGANDGRLRYIGATTRMFHVALTFTISPAANNETYVLGCAKNGTVIASGKVLQSMGSSADSNGSALHVFVELATNDYLELYVGNMTSDADLIVKSLNLFAMGM